MTPPLLSVVIPTIGRHRLRQTVESVRSAMGEQDVEVLVVGRIGDSDLAAWLTGICQVDARVKHLDVAYDRGDSSRKKNLGLEKARAPIVAYLDDDVDVAPDWPRRILDAFSRPEIGMVSGPARVPDQLGFAARMAGLALSSPAAGSASSRYRVGDSETRTVAWSGIIGCNMAFRTDLLRNLGGFDPGFWPGEEMLAAWRVQEQGRTIVFSNSAWVFHFPRMGLASFGRQMRGYGAARIRLIRAGVPLELATLAPAGLIALTAVGAVLIPWLPVARWVAAGCAGGYGLAAVAVAAVMAWRSRRGSDLALAAWIPFMHAHYGLGQWAEILRPRRDYSLRAEASDSPRPAR